MDSEDSSKNDEKGGENKRKAGAYEEVMEITRGICDGDDDGGPQLRGRDRSWHVGPFQRKCDRCGAYFDIQMA